MDLDDVVDNYKSFGITPNALAKNVLEKYVSVYEKFFHDLPDKNAPENYIYITDAVIENLKFEKKFSKSSIEHMLTPTIEGLQKMLINFKNAR